MGGQVQFLGNGGNQSFAGGAGKVVVNPHGKHPPYSWVLTYITPLALKCKRYQGFSHNFLLLRRNQLGNAAKRKTHTG